MKKLLLVAIAAFGFITVSAVAETSPTASEVIPVVEEAEQTDAALTNCSKGTSGKQGWSLCTGNTGTSPYTTQHVVVVICKKWSWLGSDSYQLAGFWAPRNAYSYANCATYYNATSPVIWFR